MKNCLFCKKEFEPKKPKAIYCSDKCRTYSNRKNKKIVPDDILVVTIKETGEQIELTRKALCGIINN